MSRQVSRRRRSGGAAQFGAPLGRKVKLVTGASLVLLVVLILAPLLALRSEPAPLWVRFLAPILLGIIFAITGLFSVRGYAVRGRELLVERPLWVTPIPLHDLKAAHVDRTAMKRSWKTMGNGGLFVYSGWFRNKRLGKYRALVTDPDRCVVMEFKDSKLVVSPDDPEGFVAALGYDTGPMRSAH